jgi:hypothetical protein
LRPETVSRKIGKLRLRWGVKQLIWFKFVPISSESFINEPSDFNHKVLLALEIRVELKKMIKVHRLK